MSKFLFILKIRFLTQIAYKLDIIISFSTNFIILLSMIYIWKSAYNNIDSMKGVTQIQMITYTIISILLTCIFQCPVQDKLLQKVSYGEITSDFIHPINLPLKWLFDDLGHSVYSILVTLLPCREDPA